MKIMIRYELKKIFCRRSGRTALLLLAFLVGVTCFFAVDVSWINERGEEEKGPAAVAALKKAQREWAGDLDEEKIRRVIAENRRIEETPEGQSETVTESNIAYGWKQGFIEIRNLLNCSYADKFREYDYYRADSLKEEEASSFYQNRIRLLKEWLAGDARDLFSENEKEYLIRQYENLSVPFSYDYAMGWIQSIEYAPTVIMITMLILGYLAAGIFSNEFTQKADAVFFSSTYGRSKAVGAKIKGGLLTVTVIYFAVFLLYTGINLCYLGAEGWNMEVQASWTSWKCFYSITMLQEYLLIALGGYIGCLFISALTMLVSAKSRSAVIAVMVPVALIFIPSIVGNFMGNVNSALANKVLGLLPDQLLQTGVALKLFNLYSFGGRIFGAVPVMMVLYLLLTAAILPVLYLEYRNSKY